MDEDDNNKFRPESVYLLINVNVLLTDRVDASAVQMKFKIMHELQSLENEVDKLKDALETHISQWFTVQVQYVTVTEVCFYIYKFQVKVFHNYNYTCLYKAFFSSLTLDYLSPDQFTI